MKWCWRLLATLLVSTYCIATVSAAVEPTVRAATAKSVVTESAIALVEPAAGAEVSQLNPAQKAYLRLPREERIEFFADVEKRKKLAKLAGYWPQPISFSWQWAGHDGADCTLHVASNQDFSKERTVTTNECQASIDNLRIHTLYYWKVTAKTADGQSATSPTWTFTTADEAPRLMRINGVPNVRDLGGRMAMDGKRVKQDLVFRSAGLNNNARCVYEDEPTQDTEKARERLQVKIAALQKQLNHHAEINYVPFSMTSSWSVFRPSKTMLDVADVAVIDHLTAVPNELFGAKREVAMMDKSGRFALDKAVPHSLTIFMQEFTSPAAGVMQIGCGGDWFWNFRINGVKVYDKILGNEVSPVTADNHVFNIPVKNGKNFAVVVMVSRSMNLVWCCAARPRVPIKNILKDQIANDEQSLRRIGRVVNGMELGANRLNDGMKTYLLDYLGIRTDLDLRSDGECYGMQGSPLGRTVTWAHYSASAYEGMQDKAGKDAFTQAFKVFCDEKNYPIVAHCIAGQDRTGSLSFILNGLLGVGEEELYEDWEATGFWNGDPSFTHRQRFNHLVEGFKKNFPQPTWREKMEAYVKSLGFTQAEIDRFRSIMLEGDK